MRSGYQRIMNRSYPGGERLTQAELTLRHDLGRYVERHIFPADREDIVASARRLHAPPDVIERFGMLPRGVYADIADIWSALHPSEGNRWA